MRTDHEGTKSTKKKNLYYFVTFVSSWLKPSLLP